MDRSVKNSGEKVFIKGSRQVFVYPVIWMGELLIFWRDGDQEIILYQDILHIKSCLIFQKSWILLIVRNLSFYIAQNRFNSSNSRTNQLFQFLIISRYFFQAEGVQCPACSYYQVVPLLYCKPTESHRQMARYGELWNINNYLAS